MEEVRAERVARGEEADWRGDGNGLQEWGMQAPPTNGFLEMVEGDRDVATFKWCGLKASTRRTYQVSGRDYKGFCNIRRISPFPPTVAAVEAWLAALGKNVEVGTVQR